MWSTTVDGESINKCNYKTNVKKNVCKHQQVEHVNMVIGFCKLLLSRILQCTFSNQHLHLQVYLRIDCLMLGLLRA